MELEECPMYSVYSTSKSGAAKIVVIDFNDFELLFLYHLFIGGVQNTYSSYSSS